LPKLGAREQNLVNRMTARQRCAWLRAGAPAKHDEMAGVVGEKIAKAIERDGSQFFAAIER
jgi:hypothetical protein